MFEEPEAAEAIGRHYLTGQPMRARRQKGGMLVEVVEKAPEDTWLAPALFDVQVNGYAGVDFQQDGLTEEELLHAARELRKAGCVQFLLALITDEWPRLLRRLEHVQKLRAASPELQRAIAGWHIEGPFLSSEPGFHGAHDPALMCEPTAEKIRELAECIQGDRTLLTLSPERKGALEAIRLAVSLGMKVSVGHTNASAEILAQAIASGATAFTHLGNGCPRELDRHDNIVWRVLETSGLKISLIPDRIHVSPPLFRLVHRALPAEAIFYTTDAMSAAGGPPGRYRLGKLELEVGSDQVVRQPGKALFAGSALKPVEGVFRAAEMLGEPWQQAWKRFSELPARVVGRSNELAPGLAPSCCVVRVGKNGELVELGVI